MSFEVFQYNRPLTVTGPDGYLYALVMNRFMTSVSVPVSFKDDVGDFVSSMRQKSWLTYYQYRLDGSLLNARKAVPRAVEDDFSQRQNSYELMMEVINPSLVDVQGTDCITIAFWTNTDSTMTEYDSSKVCVYDSTMSSFVNQTTGETATNVYSYLCQAVIQWRYVNSTYFPLVVSIKLLDYTLNRPMMDVGGESGDTYGGYFKLVMGEGVQSGGGSISPEKDSSIVVEPYPDESDSSSGDTPWIFNLQGCGVVTFCNGVWNVEPYGECDESESSESSVSGESSSSMSSSSSVSGSSSSSMSESSESESGGSSESSSSSSESEDYGTLVGVVDGVSPSRATCGYVSYGENLIAVPRAFFRVQGGEYVWVEWNDKKALVNCGATIHHQTGYWHWELLGRVIFSNGVLKPVQEHHGMISTPFSRQNIFTIIKNNLKKLFG